MGNFKNDLIVRRAMNVRQKLFIWHSWFKPVYFLNSCPDWGASYKPSNTIYMHDTFWLGGQSSIFKSYKCNNIKSSCGNLDILIGSHKLACLFKGYLSWKQRRSGLWRKTDFICWNVLGTFKYTWLDFGKICWKEIKLWYQSINQQIAIAKKRKKKFLHIDAFHYYQPFLSTRLSSDQDKNSV